MTAQSQARGPYVGPRPYERQDGQLFFGRDSEADELLSLVIAQRAVLVYAQSGAGKTSLLNARLIPMLESQQFEVLPIARVRGLIPDEVRPDEVPNVYVLNALLSWAQREGDPRELAPTTLCDYLKGRHRPTDELGLPKPRVAILDQFEELFTSHLERWKDREGFFRQVADALDEQRGDPLLRVVFVMREDYVAQMDPYAPLLPGKLRTRMRLELLRREAALAAVTGPLAGTGRSFGDGVAGKLVDDLMLTHVETTPGVSPLVVGEYVEPVYLQVVCQNLWEGLAAERTVITEADLQASGHADQALSDFYARAIRKTAQDTGARESDLRQWFERELITQSGRRGNVDRGERETGGLPNAVIEALENQHLIRGEWQRGGRWYELPTDRLIGPVQESNRKWLGGNWEWQQARQVLEAKAREWVKLGRGRTGLLSEDELGLAEEWLASSDADGADITETVRALVAETRAEAQRKADEAKRREQDRQAQAERERRRAREDQQWTLRRTLPGWILALLGLVAILATVAQLLSLPSLWMAWGVRISLMFLSANVISLLSILVSNRGPGRRYPNQAHPNQPSFRSSAEDGAGSSTLSARREATLAAGDILGMEFEYACQTASEAMAERHTMVNFYLVVTGVVATGVVAAMGQDTDLPKAVGAALLWLLVGIGWIYFLGIIRLRQAWYDSARAMNQIKEFYIAHAAEFSDAALRSAFRWQAHSLPAPDKPWTVYFYSAMLIALLDSAAFVGGGALLDVAAVQSFSGWNVGALAVLGLVFFAFHVWLYFAFLRPAGRPATGAW